MNDQQPRTSEVHEFLHSRKGPIVGSVVWENEEWMDIQLVGEQRLRYMSEANRLAGPRPDGDRVRVRKSLITSSRPV